MARIITNSGGLIVEHGSLRNGVGGSGSASDVDFANFLNPARRSVFEVANMLILFAREGYLQSSEI